MKKLGAILFGIVFILGLSIVTAPAQEVETVNPDGVVSSGYWSPDPTAGILNDWDNTDPGPDDSFIKAQDEADSLTVDFATPDGGPYTAIRVKLRADSDGFGDELYVELKNGQDSIGNFTVYNPAPGFGEYSSDEWPLDPIMTNEELKDLQVEMWFGIYRDDNFRISAIQVELISEVAAPPEEPNPIRVTIDYRPYRSSNPLNYRSRGKVRVVIFGSDDFNVRQIDRESVRLAGVAPVRDYVRKVYSRTDRARDEHEDLVLMFRAQQLIKALEESSGEELKNGDPVELELTGNLIKDDGVTPIEGEATAYVFGKRHKHKKNGKWKNHWKWWR